MARFGVTSDGFVLKPLDAILREAHERARVMFGDDVDLRDTSALNKIIQVACAEDAEIWKQMEEFYYRNYISSAVGDALDILAEDAGMPRRNLFAAGAFDLEISDPAPGRTYLVPEGTLIVTDPPVRVFATNRSASLSEGAPQASVPVQALDPGPAHDLDAGAVVAIDPQYAERYLDLGAATIAVSVTQALSGGEEEEPDGPLRNRLLGLPRTLWTLNAVRAAVLQVSGVTDVLLSDPAGGVDVSQSYYDRFRFGERRFDAYRQVSAPYFFDIVVAHDFAWPWTTTGAVEGIRERTIRAVEAVRPIGIHPNVIPADHIEVGVRARLVLEPGKEEQSILSSIRQSLADEIAGLRLGSDVLYSRMVCHFADRPGVIDVQDLHLRRCPAAMGRITFGSAPFQHDTVEAAQGENLVMGPKEIAIFRMDSDLIEFEVAP